MIGLEGGDVIWLKGKHEADDKLVLPGAVNFFPEKVLSICSGDQKTNVKKYVKITNNNNKTIITDYQALQL